MTGMDHQSLPTELLDKIFSYILLKADLKRCALVSKTYCAIAERYLYHSIYLELWRPRGDPGMGIDTLLRTLKNHPHLIPLVKKLQLKVLDYLWYGLPLQSEGEIYCLIQMLSSLQELSLNPPIPYNSRVKVLPTSPTLTSMKLDFFYSKSTFWQSSRKPTRTDLTEYLLKAGLRKLQIRHVSFAPQIHVHDFAPAAIGLRHGTSRLEELRFIDCCPSTLGILPGILRSVRHLKRFVLEINCPWQVRLAAFKRHGVLGHQISPSAFGHAMHPHCETLEELFVAFSDGASFLSDSIMQDLKDYTSLKRLAIPEPFLLLAFDSPTFHQSLPDQLEKLQIQYPMGFTDKLPDRDLPGPQFRISRMEALAEYRIDHLPNLKHVVWWYQQCQSCVVGDDNERPTYDPVVDLRGLCVSFKDHGVKFEWISNPYFGDTPLAKPLDIRYHLDRLPHEIQ